jgi:hypothetical protein
VAGKQYESIRVWRRVDPKTGEVTDFEVGDPYSGPIDSVYMLSPEGPDGRGPVIAEKSASSVEKSTPAVPGDSSSKEK